MVKRVTDKDRLMFSRLLEGGTTCATAAVQTGRSTNTLQKWARENGLRWADPSGRSALVLARRGAAETMPRPSYEGACEAMIRDAQACNRRMRARAER